MESGVDVLLIKGFQMKKHLFWKLILNDSLSVLTMIWIAISWNTADDFSKLGSIVLMVYLVISSIDAHYSYYVRKDQVSDKVEVSDTRDDEIRYRAD